MRGPDGENVDPGDARVSAAIPLAQGQIADLVALGGEPLGETPVPAFRAADRVRKQAVVDQADPHRAAKVRSSRARIASLLRDLSAAHAF